MGLLDKLVGLLTSTEKPSEEALLEAGVCPNCWGKQEYANEYREIVKDKTKSNINKDASGQKAFIEQFVETHLTGIQLKNDGEHLTCASCTGKFKKVSSKNK